MPSHMRGSPSWTRFREQSSPNTPRGVCSIWTSLADESQLAPPCAEMLRLLAEMQRAAHVYAAAADQLVAWLSTTADDQYDDLRSAVRSARDGYERARV